MEVEPEQAFRRAISAFATGVTVVCAARGDGRVSGITVNSLTSVSLRPRLLLWCLGDESERYELFAGAKLWGVTVLSAEEEALAVRFARAETEGVAEDELDMFAGAPVLRAGIGHLSCHTRETRAAGDHFREWRVVRFPEDPHRLVFAEPALPHKLLTGLWEPSSHDSTGPIIAEQVNHGLVDLTDHLPLTFHSMTMLRLTARCTSVCTSRRTDGRQPSATPRWLSVSGV